MLPRRSLLVTLVATIVLVASACTGGGGSGTSEPATDAGGASSSGGTSSGVASSGGTSSGGTSSGVLPGDAGGDASGDAATPTSCVTKSVVIAVIQTAGGQCSYKFTQAYDADKINLLLTPGWGTVCAAGSSSNCGTGSSADGWWFSASDEISVCDATCARFEKQTIAGKFTVQLGCPTEACKH